MNKATSKGTYRRLLSYLKEYKLAFIIATIGNLIYALMDVAFLSALEPLTNKGLIDQDIEFMKMVPFYIVGIVFIRGVAAFISTYLMGWIGQHIVQKMRQQLIDNYIYLPSDFYDKNSSGQMLSKITFNTQQVAAASTDAVTKLFRDGGMIIFAISALFYTNWKLTLIFLISAPVIGIIVAVTSKRFKKISRNIQGAMGGVTQVGQEIIDGYKVIKTFNGEKYESKRFGVVAGKNRRQTIKMNLTKAISTPLIQFIASFAIAGVIFFAAILLSKNELNAGEFVFMLSAMIALLKPLKVISNLNSVIQQGITAADSVFEIIDAKKEIDQGKLIFDQELNEIEFSRVNFNYPGSPQNVIKNISFHIKKGETVALVGRSGSGKSTLTNLLLRFHSETAGEILINGTNIKDFSLSSLRKNIAYVSQQTILFDNSVEANIAYAEKDIDQERLIKAAENAHALNFIERLENGFKSTIGESGNQLSGGQRQRLAIGRAIYKDSPIIILDEATSALDTESERHIQAAFDALTKNRTTIVIAHRLSTIENADNIIVLDDGEVVEQGKHKELIKLNGAYAKLHSMQFLDN